MSAVLRPAWSLSQCRGSGEVEEKAPVDVRIARWISNHTIWATIGSLVVSLPKLKPKPSRVNWYGNSFRLILLGALVDLLCRGKGAAEAQCEPFRERVREVLKTPAEELNDVPSTFVEIIDLFGGNSWQEIDHYCHQLGVVNPFAISEGSKDICKIHGENLSFQKKKEIIAEAQEAIASWTEAEVETTAGQRVAMCLRFALPIWIVRFWK